MSLTDIAARAIPPIPWSEGDNLPWHEPDFSARMLEEHLTQTHDAASRRTSKIEKHVAWIHCELLHKRSALVLDLGCGPGLYTTRLAELGYTCRGIDYAPAAIAYAREQARLRRLACSYIQEDVRTANYGAGFDLVMMLYGEFNVFQREDARLILLRAHQALQDGGRLLLEPHTFAAVRQNGTSQPTWYTTASGLFSDSPHFCLTEHFWDAEQRVATVRYFVVEADSGAVTRYAQSFQAYTQNEYRTLLEECGFEQIQVLPSLPGTEDSGLLALVARKVQRPQGNHASHLRHGELC